MTIRTITEAPALYVGDVPPSALTWILEADEPLEWVTGAAAVYVAPDGVDGGTLAATFAVESEELSVTIPSGTLTTAGLAHVRVTLTGASGAARTLAPLAIVVEDTQMGWASLGVAQQLWKDAPADPAMLYSLLESARIACEEFAPADVVGVRPLPASYLRAQLLQAQASWTAMRGNRDGELGMEGYSIPVFPLDWNVKQLLRPKSGVPVIT